MTFPSVACHVIASANLAELPTVYDKLDRCRNAIVVCFKPGDHGFDERLVRKLDAAAKGVAEKFAAELAEEVVAPSRQQIGAEAIKTVEDLAATETGARVDGKARGIFLASAA